MSRFVNKNKDILVDRLIPVAQKEAAAFYKWMFPGHRNITIPYLAYERSSFLDEVVEHTIGKKHVHLNTRFMDGLVEALKRRLLAGGGIAWIPYTSIRKDLEHDELVVVGHTEWGIPLTLSLYCAPDKINSTAYEL